MDDKPNLKGTDRDDRGKFLPGNLSAFKHGLYTFSRSNRLPVKGLAKRLSNLKAGLEAAVEDSPQRQVLIIQVCRAEALLEIIEAFMRKHGVMDKAGLLRNKLTPQPVLERTYIGLMNAQRLALSGLGLDARKAETPDIMAYVKAFDKAKAAKAVPIDTPSSGNDEGGGVAR